MGTCIYRLINHCPDQKYPDPDFSDFDVWIHNKQDRFPNGDKAGAFLSSVRQVTVIFGNEVRDQVFKFSLKAARGFFRDE